jgi:hypothetical protein
VVEYLVVYEYTQDITREGKTFPILNNGRVFTKSSTGKFTRVDIFHLEAELKEKNGYKTIMITNIVRLDS